MRRCSPADVVEALREHRGVTDTATLAAATSIQSVRRAVGEGAVVRVRQGVYCLPELAPRPNLSAALTAGSGLSALPDPKPDAPRRSWSRWTEPLSEEDALTLGRHRVLAASHRGLLSHRSAAMQHDWAVLREPPAPEIVMPLGRNLAPELRGRARVRWRPRCESEPDLVATAALPTVLMCAADLPFAEALAVADSALRSEAIGPATLRSAADRQHGPGAEQVRRVAYAAHGAADNPFESALRAVGLDVPGLDLRPQVEVSDGRFRARVDLADETLKLAVEADSYEFHGSPARFLADCVRYDELVARDWLVLRFGLRHVLDDVDWVRETMTATAEARRRSGWRDHSRSK